MSKDYEKLGLYISITGSLFLSVSAIIVAVISESQAILLDGLFTFITLIMAYISIRIVNLVKLPDNKKRPFGFSALEPFLNLIKSLIILILLITILVTNIQVLFSGGRKLDLGIAAVYTVICTVLYLCIVYIIKKYSDKTSSEILKLELKNWFVDTLITVGIAIALCTVFILKTVGFTDILPYIDPLLVIGIVLISFPIPIVSIFKELRSLLLISPENLVENEVKTLIKDIADNYNLDNINVYALKTGRKYQIVIYTQIEEDSISISLLDIIRNEIRTAANKIFDDFYLDVIFTNEP
ncbi:MAG TPA: cation transporter [Victivallales bacterium]|nr:cation transporter [Victivallales bacterium]